MEPWPNSLEINLAGGPAVPDPRQSVKPGVGFFDTKCGTTQKIADWNMFDLYDLLNLVHTIWQSQNEDPQILPKWLISMQSKGPF